jgi:hypothetical protein
MDAEDLLDAPTEREEVLAARYAYFWLRKVFPHGTAHQRSLDNARVCPVRSVLIQSEQDEILSLSWISMQPMHARHAEALVMCVQATRA